MRNLITALLILISVTSYAQTTNTTNTKFTNGLAVPNGATQKPTSGLTAGALSYVTGTGLYVYNGTSWVLLATSTGGVTSFNSRTGVVVPLIGDYSSFYVPLTRTLTINGATQSLEANRTWTVTANTTNSLTAGYGITGGVFDGSVARTWVADTSSATGLVSKPRLDATIANYVPKPTTITINGVTQDLSQNRTYNVGSVTSIGITPGTGISVSGSPVTSSGNITVTNTAPDQTVVLNEGTGIGVTGTYPNFTITNTSPSSGGTVTSVTAGNGLTPNSPQTTGVSFRVDTTAIQTVANFFPKGDTRYAKNTDLTGYLPLTAGITKPLTGILYQNLPIANNTISPAQILTNTTSNATAISPAITFLRTFTGGTPVNGSRIFSRGGSTLPSFTVQRTLDNTTWVDLMSVNPNGLSFNNSGSFSAFFSNGNLTGSYTYELPNYGGHIATNPMTSVGDIVYGGTVVNSFATPTRLAGVATGNALISGGVGTAPSWGKIGLTTHVSGILPIANGGTNASSASITAFNNITGYSASGATGTTSTNLVFSTSPTLITATLSGITTADGVAVGGSGINMSGATASTDAVFDGTKGIISNAVTGTGSSVRATSPTLVTPVLGVASGTSLNLSGLTASQAVATDGSKNLVSVATTGTGSYVLATSPTLVTPNIGIATGNRISLSATLGTNAVTASVSGSSIAYLTLLAGTGDLSGFWQVAGNTAGSITHPTNTTTAYNTTSDYRIKENLKPLTGGLDAIMKLKTYTGNYIPDPTKTVMPMFLAHEVQAVVPIAVTGKKDAMKLNKETGKMEMAIQQLDASKLIPHMVKAIQELEAKVEVLEANSKIK